MTPTWGQFMTKLRALYAEYPSASEQYESEYKELAARLAEAEALLRDALTRLRPSNGDDIEDYLNRNAVSASAVQK